MERIRWIFWPLIIGHLRLYSVQGYTLRYGGEACDGQILDMVCPPGFVISFTSVFYGRDDLNLCLGDEPERANTTTCSQPEAVTALERKCNKQVTCEFDVDSESLGGDPCPGTSKFLKVKFNCSEPVLQGVQCEGSKLSLECPNNLNIHVTSVIFGRQETVTCSQEAAIMHTNCTSPTALTTVSQLCEGRSTCDVYAVSSLLGEPCEGTYKYLKVSYTCYACTNVYSRARECEGWADDGECAVNVRWMAAFCRQACTKCQFRQACENSHNREAECDAWAGKGECQLNQEWMPVHCRRSCNQCPLEPAPTTISTVSTTTGPSTTPIFVPEWEQGDCFNRHDDAKCNFWASIGECPANPYWMAENCAEACGVCQHNDTVLCDNVDTDDDCDFWTSIGECRSNPPFMLINCRKSCGLCTNDTERCQDLESTQHCQFYHNIGECEDNSLWMMEFCKLTCGFCGTNTTQSTLAPHEACVNTYGNDTKCDLWASEGECTLNQDWMRVRCGLACGVCHTLPPGPCGDLHKDPFRCKQWAGEGRCLTSQWMNEFCAESCGLCQNTTPMYSPGVTGTSTTPTPPIHTGPCVNRDGNTTVCELLAEEDQCDVDTHIKAWDCLRSCQLCTDTDGVESQAVCETETASLACNDTQGLRIYEAFFGRRSNTTCPHVSIQSTDCPSHWAVTPNVRWTCEGRQFCHVTAHTDIFTDPCPGTFKYLEVKYTCQECENAHASDQDCARWAEQGDCQTNTYWMLDNCFKTCSHCHVSECSNPVGDDVSCDYWSMREECVINSGWMKRNCQESCRECTEEVRRPDTTAAPTQLSSPRTTERTTLPAPTESSACEGQTLTMTCPPTAGIVLLSAFYGRKELDLCGDGSSDDLDLACSDEHIFEKVQRDCNGVSDCEVAVLPGDLGNPCPGTPKYLIVTYECQVLSEFTCTPPCGDHGRCVRRDTCVCDEGYTEAGCSQVTCAQVKDCSGHGTCEGPNDCMCDPGWMGLDCSEAQCYGVANCSNHGQCIGPDQCWCFPYLSGRDCSQCFVGFQTGPACLPCPDCVNGHCVQDDGDPGGSYLGCFRDVSGNHDLELLSWVGEETHTAACMQRCHARGYKYAGLQSGDTCYCGNNYGKHGSSSQCDTACNAGQPGEICGGRLANSVWRVYEGYCQCYGPNWTGTRCDRCSPGYAGANCLPTGTTMSPSPSTPTPSPPSSPSPPSTTSTPTAGVSSTPRPSPPSTPSTTLPGSSTAETTSSTPAPSSSASHPTTTPGSFLIIIELELQWKPEYSNSDDPATSGLLWLLKSQLDEIYNGTVAGYSEIVSLELRPGPDGKQVTVLTEVNSEVKDTDPAWLQVTSRCQVEDALSTRRLANNVHARITKGDRELCETMDDFCGENGELVAHSSDNTTWSCSCESGYSGQRCENSSWETKKAVIIIVVCCVGPLLLVGLLCIVLRHRRFKQLTFSPDPDSTNCFRYQNMDRAPRSSSRKLFNTQKTEEHADADGFTPRQI